jgi:hypothetical protein
LTLDLDPAHSLILRADLASEWLQRRLHVCVPLQGCLIALPSRWPRAEGQRRCFVGTAGAHTAERHLHLASPWCTVCRVKPERLPRARQLLSIHFARLWNADGMVMTGPLHVIRTQKNEGGKLGWIVHKWRAKVTQRGRGVAHATALLTMCFVGL